MQTNPPIEENPMTATDTTCEAAAITPYVRGVTLCFGTTLPSSVPTEWDPQQEGVQWPTLSGTETGSVETVVAVWELEKMPDPLACMSEWRRVLTEGGRLVLTLRAPGSSDEPVQHNFTPGYLVALVNRLGGFKITTIEDAVPGSSWILVAERNQVAEIRAPLGMIGAELAGSARQSEDARSELYFQIGTVFLQAGDPAQAEACFKSMLAMEPDNTQGLFGLGMSYGTQGRWTEAQVELQRVVDREPNNEDARRWMMLAVERSSGNPGTAKAPPLKTIPRAGSLRV
jgi:hypothetical protein